MSAFTNTVSPFSQPNMNSEVKCDHSEREVYLACISIGKIPKGYACPCESPRISPDIKKNAINIISTADNSPASIRLKKYSNEWNITRTPLIINSNLVGFTNIQLIPCKIDTSQKIKINNFQKKNNKKAKSEHGENKNKSKK